MKAGFGLWLMTRVMVVYFWLVFIYLKYRKWFNEN